MNIKVLYFARIKESVNYSTEDIMLPADVNTVVALKTLLAERGEYGLICLAVSKWCERRLTMS